MGVATERDLRDYFRMGPADMVGRIDELVEEGELIAAEVRGCASPLMFTKTRWFRAERGRPPCSPRSTI